MQFPIYILAFKLTAQGVSAIAARFLEFLELPDVERRKTYISVVCFFKIISQDLDNLLC